MAGQASVTAGENLTVTDRTMNRGQRSARTSVTGFYLSKDATRSADDIQLGSRSIPVLKARRSSRVTQALQVPLMVPGARYHLVACADDTRRVAEASERNNCRTATQVLALSSAPVAALPAGPLPPVHVAVTKDGSGTGKVTSDQGGIDCGSTCTANFVPTGPVTLTATADPGSRFVQWSGDCTSSDPTCVVTSLANATFIKRVTATGGVASGGSVKVSSPDPAASCTDVACEIDLGQDSTFEAVPDTGYRFAAWGGDCTGQQAVKVTITGLTRDAQCIASFTRTYRISWSGSPAGGGTVNGGIVSGSGSCDAGRCDVDPGSTVQLTRTTTAGYRFLGWNDGCASSTTLQSTTITLSNIQQDYACTASWVLQHTITWSVLVNGVPTAGAGTVTVGTTSGYVVCQTGSCAGDATGSTAGHLSLTASPNGGYRFANWSCTGNTTNPLSLDFTVNRVCNANFVHQVTVTFGTNNAGGGSVTGNVALASGASGTCGATSCTVDDGSDVILTANDDANYIFSSWSGDCTGSTQPYTFSAISGAAKTCTANFVPR